MSLARDPFRLLEENSDYARTSSRGNYDTNVRYPTHGFRVALSLKER